MHTLLLLLLLLLFLLLVHTLVPSRWCSGVDKLRIIAQQGRWAVGVQ
jgi:hypothetical protein